MSEWKRAFEVPEVKQVIMESRGEVLDEVVQEYLAKNMAKAAKGKSSDADGNKRDGEDESNPSAKPEEDQSADNDDLYYFSKQDGAYKVFDPRTKQWTAQPDKPSVEIIKELRSAFSDARQEEQKLIDEIHRGIAGETGDAPIGSPTTKLERRDSSAAAEQIATLAAQSVLKKMSSSSEKEALAEEDPLQAVDEAGKPLSAEELKLKELKRLKKKRYMENKKRKWYQTKVNNYIYIQGLPNDITEQELKEYFIRCGVLRLDPFTGKE